jgi:hypothetical protein
MELPLKRKVFSSNTADGFDAGDAYQPEFASAIGNRTHTAGAASADARALAAVDR